MNTYIDRIIAASESNGGYRGRHVYKVGRHYVSFWRDDNGEYLGGRLQYTGHGDLMWTWSNAEEFYNRYLSGDNTLKFEVHSMRFYGQPKLTKPTELRGVRQAFSVDYIRGKCRCPVFIHGKDVWVRHGDYFSESRRLPSEDRGKPLGYLARKYVGERSVKSFIYPDAWGDIVLRNEAWLQVRALAYRLQTNESPLRLRWEILRQQERAHGWGTNELEVGYEARFWENVINETKRYLNDIKTEGDHAA